MADLEYERRGLGPALAVLGAADSSPAVAKRYELAVRAGDAPSAARWRQQLEADPSRLGSSSRRPKSGWNDSRRPAVDREGTGGIAESSDLRFRKATALERSGRFDESAAFSRR